MEAESLGSSGGFGMEAESLGSSGGFGMEAESFSPGRRWGVRILGAHPPPMPDRFGLCLL